MPIAGQESAAIEIHNGIKGLQMIYSAFGHGAVLVSGPSVGGQVPWDDDGVSIAVDQDRWGLRAARFVGRMVAETALVVKAGRQALGDEAMERLTVPYHKLPKVLGRLDGAPPIPSLQRPEKLPKSIARPAQRVVVQDIRQLARQG
jgi:hypothetical protein